MALEKAVVPISFAGGIDTKTDDKQVIPGKLLLLENAKFQTAKELRKVPGDAPLSKKILASSNLISNGVSIAPFQKELVLNSGSEIYSYSPADEAWSDKGPVFTISMETNPVIRNNFAQVNQDSATHPSGLQVFAWEDSSGGARYSVIDSTNNLQIQSNVLISSIAQTPKCAVAGNFLIIFYYEASPNRLRYLSIPIANPTLVPSPGDIASNVDPTNPVFDASMINEKIYVAYNVIGGGISYFSLNAFLSKSVVHTQDSENASVALNVFGDTNNIWFCYYNGTAVKCFITDPTLITLVQPPTVLETLANVRNITGSILTTGIIFYEVSAPITYNTFIRSNTFTVGGVVGTPKTVIRSVGIGSKAFTYNTNIFFMATYEGPLQPGYFLINQNGVVAAKLAPQTGGGLTAKSTLPQVNLISESNYQFSYLQQDFIATTNGGNFFLTGVMQTAFNFNPTGLISVDLGNGLQTTGGFLSSYDGVSSVELGYHVFPEQITVTPSFANGGLSAGSYQWSSVYAWTDNFGQIHRSAPSVPTSVKFPISQPVTFTATFIPGDLFLHLTSSAALQVGQTVLDSTTPGNFSPGTTITSISTVGTSVVATISTPTLGASAAAPGDSLTAAIAPLSFKSVFNTGQTQITVDNATGLFIGQTITDTTTSANLLAPTTITAIDGNVITLSNPTQGPSASSPGDTLQTLDVYSAELSIPTLRITAKQSPIRANAWIEVYRTQANQSLFFLVSSITDPIYNNTAVDTVPFTDVESDIFIQSNLQLYTTGGVLENISPPAPKLIWQYRGRLILVPSEAQNSWWYSKEVVPGIPIEFTDSFVNNMDQRDGPITAGAQMDSEIVFFKGPTSVFYVTGEGPDSTGNNNDFTLPQIVPTGAGCVSPFSVVSTPGGLFYKSLKGIYLLDRSLQAKYIGAEVEAFNSANITSGQLIQNDNEIRYTLDTGMMLMYDYQFSQWTTIPQVEAVSSCTFENQFCYVQADGTVLQEDPNIWTHNGNFRRIKLVTSWLSLNSLQGFQRV